MTKTNIRPLGNRVLIKRCKKETTKGGILLPDSAQEKSKEGVVIAVGPGKLNDDGKIESMQLAVGDLILFSSYAGTEVKDQETQEEFLILSEEDVLGVLS